jgi:hypothetical protein
MHGGATKVTGVDRPPMLTVTTRLPDTRNRRLVVAV